MSCTSDIGGAPSSLLPLTWAPVGGGRGRGGRCRGAWGTWWYRRRCRAAGGRAPPPARPPPPAARAESAATDWETNPRDSPSRQQIHARFLRPREPTTPTSSGLKGSSPLPRGLLVDLPGFETLDVRARSIRRGFGTGRRGDRNGRDERECESRVGLTGVWRVFL